MTIKCKYTFSQLLLCLTLFLMACGGGSGSSEISPPDIVPPVVAPPAEPTISVYGLYEISIVGSEVMHMLLTKERSYLFSIASNTIPPTEQMCVSNEPLLAFSENLSVQTLLYNCTKTEESSITTVIELNKDIVTVDYSPEKMIKTTIPLANVIKLTTPHFSALTSGSYKTPVRKDINISRLIAASSRSTNIWVNVASRDIPMGGQCHDSLIFEINDLSSVEITDSYERVSIPYRSTDTQLGNNCDNSLLPNPSRIENIDVHFYTLSNGKYFAVIEQNTFITMGILYKEY
ncbi:MAG: hypothetical protein ACI9LM_002487 [Alteromonadaceae bacterium]|jgi:hypothetical protein